MRCSGFVFVLLLLWGGPVSADAVTVGPHDWPWWRGPARNGIADSPIPAPTKWCPTQNIAWSVPIPGRGHGSPTVVGDDVYLATAEHTTEVQSVICIDRLTGKIKWTTPVHRGHFEKKGNTKSSLASSTIACDGQLLFVNFLNQGAIYTTALDRTGKQRWQQKITDYTLHQGFGSSPAIYESLVIITADNKGTGIITALERATGKPVWKHERPKLPNYPSPIILRVGNQDHVFITGCDLVTSLNPLTGKVNWETKGSTTECVTSTVTDGKHIFTSGGYPKNHVSAYTADGTAKLVWENNIRVYVPSMLVKNGHLFAVQDAGVAMCWKSDTGKEIWKGRLNGTFSASPVLVNDLIYATNESGKTFIFKASTTGLDIIAENQLGEDVYATPTICGGRIYMRVAKVTKGERQEMLYCIATASK